MTQNNDPKWDVRAMKNRIDVKVRLEGLTAGMNAERRTIARKLMDHCTKTGLSVSEVESFKEMAIGILDYRPEEQPDDTVQYQYRSDGQTLDLNALAGATACLPQGITATMTLSKDGDEVQVDNDPKNTGYWNYICLKAEKGNFTYQALGHRPEGASEPDADTLREITEGNFCGKVEELGYMAMAFSSHEAALEQQRQRQEEAAKMLEKEEEAEAEEDKQWG